ncbi:helix-turn-helix domain-containing protein [Pedobacter sp. SYP-B3415]|uniref:AraC family transcriptional regulator n=1 Tax=Pedobacter sp. SYP-B3415 TaxID=2496641 RepID=UPI00101DEEE5|nr:helix-turn-helix domain-containing protein [Pedobacter sp. SYP-B3415]
MPLSLFKYLHQAGPAEIARLAPRAVPAQLVSEILIVPAALIPDRSVFFSDGCPTLVITANPHSRLLIERAGQTVTLHGGWVGSPYFENRCLDLQEAGDFLVIFRFRPALFFEMTALPPADLRSQAVLPLERIGFSHPGAGLTAEEHVNNTEHFLALNRIANDAEPRAKDDLLNYLQDSTGSLNRLSEVHGKNAAAYKRLERAFNRHTGMAPKEFLTLQRFLRTYQCLTAEKAPAMTAAAAMNGYCDQSHMIRDFKKFTGAAPAALLRKQKY